ncbi:MAG: hypothetical protein QOD51_1185, partial [Candidatus Eremiobacteraeota bacterium]|nr:hypothetical protein [Candidatus Eremiobacteraeota bacterium]
SNVRRAARGRGQTKPAVLVIAPSSPRNSTPRGRRLRSLVSGFAEAGHRVVFLPHDLAEAQPWTGEMQHAGVEVLYDIPGDARGWSEHLADVLPTVDAVVIRGAELVRRYLPAIRARCGVPIVYDAERLGESDDGARAASVAAADGTLVETEREAELIRAERLGPVAVMAAAHDSEPPSFTDAHALLAGLLSPAAPVVPETRVAAALVQEYQSGEQPPNAYDGTAAGNDLEPARTAALFARFFEERARADQIARERDRFSETLTATSGELDQERAAHRKTFRREAEARLARQHADGLIQQQAAELERLVRCREADDEERKLLLLQLARAQSLAAARTAEARDGSSEAGALIVPPEQDAALAAS